VRRCPHCDGPLTLLFFSAVCDWCEGPPRGTFYRGYVIWQEPELGDAISTHVFRTPHDALVYRAISGLDALEIRSVLSEQPFPWRVASGKASGLVCTDQPFDVHRTHRFRREPQRAFLAPADCPTTRERVQLSPTATLS
jgi:hypothetical protein